MTASEAVQQVWQKWTHSAKEREDAVKLLPFLQEEGEDKTYLRRKLITRRQLPLLQFTVEEFSFIPIDKTLAFVVIDLAAEQRNYPLLFVLVRIYGRHGACCVFDAGTAPRVILEQMQANLAETGIATAYVPEVDYDEMLRHGMIPCPIFNDVDDNTLREVLRYRREGFSNNEIAYWTGVLDAYDYLCKISLWSFVTLDYIEERAKEGNSYAALFLYPELLYKSMRPRTAMKMFRTPVSHTYSSLEEVPEKRLAVSRYAKGMSKGMFYETRPKDICGYFYYAELESTTFLHYRKAFTAFNKTDAAMKLLKKKESRPLAVALRRLQSDQRHFTLLSHLKGELPADLRFSPDSAWKLLSREGSIDYAYVEHSQKKVYFESSLYAYEDDLDQPLCKAAAELGYDLVILTHMVGSYQVVTEVLDTRLDSMKHLWFASAM